MRSKNRSICRSTKKSEVWFAIVRSVVRERESRTAREHCRCLHRMRRPPAAHPQRGRRGGGLAEVQGEAVGKHIHGEVPDSGDSEEAGREVVEVSAVHLHLGPGNITIHDVGSHHLQR